MSKDGQMAVYDFTLAKDEWTHTQVIEGLEGYVKKYCFQLEKSDTGFVHYQGRISLVKKRYKLEAARMLSHVFPKMHLTVTSNEGRKSCFYVMKKDTHVSGPWSDTDPKPMYVPRHIRECKELRPFQKSILDMAATYKTRVIDVIYCPKGNKGKSILIGKARAAGYRCLPPVFDYKDIMRMVLCMPTATAYFIDMPRAIKQEKMCGFFAGMETIKDGYAYDDRYTFKEKTFDSPRIFLFTNKLPDKTHLSADRWKIWEISQDFLLLPYDPNDPMV